jgi:hypothetical protein
MSLFCNDLEGGKSTSFKWAVALMPIAGRGCLQGRTVLSSSNCYSRLQLGCLAHLSLKAVASGFSTAAC